MAPPAFRLGIAALIITAFGTLFLSPARASSGLSRTSFGAELVYSDPYLRSVPEHDGLSPAHLRFGLAAVADMSSSALSP